MIEVVGVKFPKDFKIHYCDVGTLDLKYGNWCLAETYSSRDLAKVVENPKAIRIPKHSKTIGKIIRLIKPEEWKTVEENKKKEKDAFHFCLKKIQERNMIMKLVTTHYTFDGGKLIFYFTAEGRVDFRELVKDLSHHFKTRIELRQIGVRDEAKLYDSCGWCGRELCCTTFLKEFDSVQIKMAKEQNLILTPGKISGVCGRLMCCLAYEYETYVHFRKQAPNCGTKVITQKGEGIVQSLNVVKEQVIVKLEDSPTSLPFALKDIRVK